MGPLEDTVSKRKLVYVPAIVPTLHHIEPALLGSSYFTDLILVVIRFDSLNWKRLTFSCSQGSVCMAIMVNELSQFLFPLKQKKTATIRRRRRRGRTTPPHEARGNEATK